MSLEYGMPIVLPPIGPLFASSGSLPSYESEEQREQYEEDMARYFGVPMPSYLRRKKPPQPTDDDPANLRTPTSVQPNASSLPPSSSPIKKDALVQAKKDVLLLVKKPVLQLSSPTQKNVTEFLSSFALGKEEKQLVNRERSRLHTSIPPSSSPTKKDELLPSKKDALLLVNNPVLQLSSPAKTNVTEFLSSFAMGEEEKQRVNRERNRLHAQRTRIRKRELLESLKERIDALQDEHELLRQAYDFHATAVCLLHLGNVVELPCVDKLEQVGVDATEDRDENGQLCDGATHDSDVDVDVEQDDPLDHDKSCAALDEKEGDACSCPQLNANGKRPYAATASNMCSKEERERVRRERNRLHARRARLRKKLVLERSQQAVHDLRERNDRLRSRLSVLVSSIYGSEACLDDPDATS